WRQGGRDYDDSRGRHDDSMQHGESFRAAAIRDAPINKTEQRHQRERFRISGDEKEGGRMCNNRKGTEEAQRRRNLPALAKKKEVSPETPGRELSGERQSCFRFELQRPPKETGKHWIRRKESNVRDLHHLMINGR